MISKLAAMSTTAVAALALLIGGAPTQAQTDEHSATPSSRAVAIAVGEVASSTSTTIATCGSFAGVQTASGSPSYVVPSNGVITSFRHNPGAGDSTPVRGLIFRSTTVAADKTLIGKSALTPVTPGVLMTLRARIPVLAGDLLGIQVTGDNTCAFASSAADSYDASNSFDPDSSTAFHAENDQTGSRWNISAILEQDADQDGFGDISQDGCPQSALTQTVCQDPRTEIGQAPSGKTTQRKNSITFTSNVKGATFQCSVDKKAYAACTSPFKKRFKLGKHVVLVRAVSPYGPVDQTPAKIKFKVVKPKKKR